MAPVQVNSGEFRRAAFLSILGLFIAWWYQVERVVSDPSATNFTGYTLFWLTFTYIVLYYMKTVRDVSSLKSRALINPTFPNLPRKRRESLFDHIPNLTKAISPAIATRASFSYLARRLSTFDASTPLPASEVDGTKVVKTTKIEAAEKIEAPWERKANPYKELMRKLTHTGTFQGLKGDYSDLAHRNNDDDDDDDDDDSKCADDEEGSTCSTYYDPTPKSKRSSSTECTSTLITCNTIDIRFGNPAEVMTALSIVLLIGFITATYSQYGMTSIFIGMTTGLGICNLAELLKVISEPVTLRWIMALSAFHSLNLSRSRLPFLSIY